MYRTVYVTALLLLMCTAWLVLAGTQIIRNVGDMARFGSILFQTLAPLQLAVVVFLAAMGSASAVAQEKDRRTLILLLLTRLSNSELVVGKLLASLLNLLVMVAASLPVFMLTTLLGGVSFDQVARVFGVTLITALLAGSLGSTLALWREKTFQTLAMTALIIVLWLGFWEAVCALYPEIRLAGITVSSNTVAVALSPLRAIEAAARPVITGSVASPSSHAVLWYIVAAFGGAAVLNLVAVVRLRIWNPSRELRRGQAESIAAESIWGVEHELAEAGEESLRDPERARAGHVDSRERPAQNAGPSRQVWDNPVLWREICTWAYGRKVIVIRAVYVLFFLLAWAGLYWTISQGWATTRGDDLGTVVPVAARPLVPFFLVSLVIVNALAVTSITNERDGQALDLLLATDLSSREFVFGKVGGILWVTREMVGLPMLLSAYLWWYGGIDLERLLYVLAGLAVMNLFVAMLGVHCGMTYANSRTAITVSLGSVFFLFLGVVTCMLIMISFSGSFENQFLPFAAFILGGGVGLYVALGVRNPSAAIQTASLLLPIATFHAITSFLLGHSLNMFLVTTTVYGFTTAAMLIPAIDNFDIAMGRTKTAGDE